MSFQEIHTLHFEENKFGQQKKKLNLLPLKGVNFNVFLMFVLRNCSAKVGNGKWQTLYSSTPPANALHAVLINRVHPLSFSSMKARSLIGGLSGSKSSLST